MPVSAHPLQRVEFCKSIFGLLLEFDAIPLVSVNPVTYQRGPLQLRADVTTMLRRLNRYLMSDRLVDSCWWL
jgi:hypothetical protein